MFDAYRRRFLYQSLTGVGGLALMHLLNGRLEAAPSVGPLAPKTPHHAPKAKSCIFLTMLGGVSQMDTFDRKPALKKFDNTVMDWSKEKNTDQPHLFAKPRYIYDSPFAFKKYGQSGMEVSDLFPHVGTCVDDLAFIRSIQTENGNHPAAVFLMNTGSVMPGRPSMGAWTTFGLGTENQNLPAFVVLPDFRTLPFSGSQQWGNGFLPASYQGTALRWKGDAVYDLHPPKEVTPDIENLEMGLLRSYNHEFLEKHLSNPELQGRIDSYELAYRMQAEVPGVADVRGESEAVKEMYGLNGPTTESFGTRCLMARRLVEHGVRFIQLYTPNQAWDSHGKLEEKHAEIAKQVDQPIAGLLKDLKQRGLLDSTLVVWMGEFGRTPDCMVDTRKTNPGRDHNTRAMTIWMAGGGIKPGVIVGATDDLGFKAVQDPYRMRDVHATILDRMGLNNLQLTYYHAGRNMRLTDTGGNVISQVLA
jgi:hypothetical protein